MLQTAIDMLRDRFHPLFYLRKYSLYHRLTQNLRIPVTTRIDKIKYRIHVDLIRNMAFVLSRHSGEDIEMKNFATIVRPLNVTQFWDVGANVGLYSFLFWTLNETGTTVLFEPDPYNVYLLKRSLHAHPHLHATLIEKAVSERQGMVNFSTDDITGATGSISDHGGASFIERHHKVIPRKINVETTTLDAMARFLPAPQLVKIDVEGVEDLVFAGAKALISTYHPAFMFEADAEFDLAPLHVAGYQIFDFKSLCPTNVAAHNNLALHPKYHATVFAAIKAQ